MRWKSSRRVCWCERRTAVLNQIMYEEAEKIVLDPSRRDKWPANRNLKAAAAMAMGSAPTPCIYSATVNVKESYNCSYL